MPVLTKPPSAGNTPTPPRGGDVLSTRRGIVAVAAVVALLAAAVLLTFLNQYRSSVADDGEAAKVLVASGLIAKGSSGDVLSSEGLFRTASVRRDQLETNAITDPAALRGKVAVQDVLPGQQLTRGDFTAPRNRAQVKLGANHRAVAIPVDEVHGLTGLAAAGDRVDVLAAFSTEGAKSGVSRPVVKPLLTNVLVLRAATDERKHVVLRVRNDLAAKVAYAAEHGKLWVALRPGTGGEDLPSEAVTIESVLLDRKPIRVSGGGR